MEISKPIIIVNTDFAMLSIRLVYPYQPHKVQPIACVGLDAECLQTAHEKEIVIILSYTHDTAFRSQTGGVRNCFGLGYI